MVVYYVVLVSAVVGLFASWVNTTVIDSKIARYQGLGGKKKKARA